MVESRSEIKIPFQGEGGPLCSYYFCVLQVYLSTVEITNLIYTDSPGQVTGACERCLLEAFYTQARTGGERHLWLAVSSQELFINGFLLITSG